MSSRQVELITKLRDQLTGPLGRMRGAFRSFAGAIGAAYTTGRQVFGSLLSLAQGLGVEADRTLRSMALLGGSAEEVQALNYAFTQTQGSADTANNALRGMANFLQQVRAGSGEAIGALGDLGLSLADLEGMSTTEKILTLSERMYGLGDATERSTRAQTVFGRAYQDVIASVGEAGGSLRGLVDRFDSLNIAMSEDTIRALDDFNDRWKELGTTLKGEAAKALVDVLPQLEAMGTQLVTLARESLPELIPLAVDFAKAMADNLPAVITMLGAVADGWERISDIASRTPTDATQDAADGWKVLQDAVDRGTMSAEEAADVYADLTNPLASVGNYARASEDGFRVLWGSLFEGKTMIESVSESWGAFSGSTARSAVDFETARAGADNLRALGLEPLDQILESIYSRLQGAPDMWAQFQTAGQGIIGMVQNVWNNIQPETAGAIAESSGRGAAEKSPEEQKLDRTKEAIQELRDMNTARLDDEAARQQELADLEAQRIDAERAAKEEDWGRMQQLADKQSSMDRDRMNAMQQYSRQATNFVVGFASAMRSGRDAAKEWGEEMLRQILILLAQKGLELLLNLVTGGLGGKAGGLFGFFHSGGGVKHAAQGLVIPGHGYGDKTAVIAEPGEEISSRAQVRERRSREMFPQSRGGSGSGWQFVYSPVISTASRAEMAAAGKVIAEVAKREGL